MIKLYKVSGNSLSPEYQPGDYLLVALIPFLFHRLNAGDVIVFKHPLYGVMLKKVAAILPETGEVVVSGTQEDSVDSRRFGPISKASFIGKVIWHIRPRGAIQKP